MINFNKVEEVLELTEVEEQIKDILNQVCLEWHSNLLKGDKNWTVRIKKLIAELGVNLGYNVYASGIDCYHGEWLYDLVWFKNNNEGRLISVPLVLESEWKRDLGNIKYDFEKLLLSNSQYRVMICQARYNIPELRQYFYKAVEDYEALKKGDRFFIAILDDFDTGKFFFDLVIKQ